jgi:DNA-binding response OmpR family regulator
LNKILVVDDEPRIVSVIESYLSQYGHEVITAFNGPDALALVEKANPDLIVLDVMMPGMDGYEVLRRLRQQADTPVIFLTARVEEEDQVLGLELGADDYVVKPFRPRELVARIKAVLRRASLAAPVADTLIAQDITLSRDSREVVVGQQNINLTPSEFDLLAALMSQPGRVFSRLDLLDIIQGVRFEGYERTIDIHIKNLRAKLGDKPRQPKYIQTVYGAGYRFLAGRGRK